MIIFVPRFGRILREPFGRREWNLPLSSGERSTILTGVFRTRNSRRAPARRGPAACSRAAEPAFPLKSFAGENRGTEQYFGPYGPLDERRGLPCVDSTGS